MAVSVLVVDDSIDEVIITKRAIKKSGISVDIKVAGSGEEAVELLEAASEMPYIILLDLKMPGMDGVETLYHIRQQEKSRYIPVVMLTSSILHSDVKACYDAGANGYSVKAADMSKFMDEIKTILHYWLDFNLSALD